jgi:hypothetical protein
METQRATYLHIEVTDNPKTLPIGIRPLIFPLKYTTYTVSSFKPPSIERIVKEGKWHSNKFGSLFEFKL